MRRLLPLFLLLFILPLRAEILVVGCNGYIPPYVIQQNDRGIILDILRAALSSQGYQLKISYGNNTDNVHAFNEGMLDVACISNVNASPEAYFSSQPLLEMQNLAVILDTPEVTINSVADLSRYRVSAFNNATHLLTAPYAAAVSRSPQYTEYSDQSRQVASLFSHQSDVLILDQTIFRYYLSQLRRLSPNDTRLHSQYRFRRLFDSYYYYIAFHSEAVRNAFDEGLRIIRENGDYQHIMESYQKLLADYLLH